MNLPFWLLIQGLCKDYTNNYYSNDISIAIAIAICSEVNELTFEGWQLMVFFEKLSVVSKHRCTIQTNYIHRRVSNNTATRRKQQVFQNECLHSCQHSARASLCMWDNRKYT